MIDVVATPITLAHSTTLISVLVVSFAVGKIGTIVI